MQKRFLKLDGVEGESKCPRHFGEIEITSLTWGVSNNRHGVGRGKAQMNEMTFTKQMDKTSPILKLACQRGDQFDEGILTMEEVSESGSLHRTLVVKLKSILIASLTATAGAEEIGVNYESVEMMPS